jgi:peptidoglycan/LPS O-acetylase OafA/YrhL
MLATQTKSVSSPEQPTIGKNLRSEGLDFARGIAILMVIVLHVIVLTPGLVDYEIASLVAARMGSGVQLFFVLSGILICRSWERSCLSGENKFGFYVRRISKIAPLYYLFFVINILLFFLEKSLSDTINIRNSISDNNFNYQNIFLHLFLLQGFSPSWIHTIVDGSWSIVCEVYFYIFAPFIIQCIKCLRNMIWFLFISIIFAIIFIIAIGRYHSGYSFYAFPVQFPCFILGIICYRVTKNVFIMNLIERYAAPIAAIAAVCALTALRFASKPLPESLLPGVCGAAFILTSGALATSSPRLVKNFLMRIGQQSYALFFVHMTLLKISLMSFMYFGYSLPLPVHLLINLLVGIFGSLIFSQLIFDPIDRACVGAASAWLKKRAQKLGEIK